VDRSLEKPFHIEQEQAEIDLEIARLHECTRRNSLCFIHRLPNELLLEILLARLRSSPSSNAIIPVAHVCGRWRGIAVNSPLLWSRLDLGELHPSVVELSKSSPIRLYFREILYGLPGSVGDFVSTNFHRVQELSIHASETSVCAFLDAIREQGAPLLQTAKISAWSEGNSTHPSLSALFNGNTPQLQNLTIEHMKIDWTWAVFSQLTHLRIRVLEKSHSGLFSILRRMPHLVALDLEESLPDYHGGHLSALSSSDAVDLPNLQRLKLDDASLRNCTLFVHQLHIPATAYIRLHIWVGPHGQGVVQSGQTRLLPPICAPSENLDVCWVADAVCFNLPFFQMRFEGGWTEVCFTAALPAVLGRNSIKYLRFDMQHDHSWSEMDWIRSLGRLPHLSSLEFTMNKSGVTLLRALSAVQPGDLVQATETERDLILPRLQRLVLTLTETEVCIPLICMALAARTEMNSRIPEIQLALSPQCKRLTPAEIDELGGLSDVLEVM
jgi:hypothetical protein